MKFISRRFQIETLRPEDLMQKMRRLPAVRKESCGFQFHSLVERPQLTYKGAFLRARCGAWHVQRTPQHKHFAEHPHSPSSSPSLSRPLRLSLVAPPPLHTPGRRRTSVGCIIALHIEKQHSGLDSETPSACGRRGARGGRLFLSLVLALSLSPSLSFLLSLCLPLALPPSTSLSLAPSRPAPPLPPALPPPPPVPDPRAACRARHVQRTLHERLVCRGTSFVTNRPPL